MRKFVFGGSFTSFVFDPDALAYFAANTAITSDADKLEIDAFYKGLKADGIYTKIKAMYLPIWGSAADSKWNLIDPRDLDAAFRLTFNGGITFSSTGITGNALNGWANTHLIPFNAVLQDSTHISYYSRTNSNGSNFVEMGNGDSPFNRRIYIAPRFNGATSNYRAVNSNQVGPGTSPSDTRGLFMVSRISPTQMKQYQNTTILHTDNVNSNGLQSYTTIAIMCTVDNFIRYYSNRECAFASIGLGFNDTEQSLFYSRVQTLMTYFGINV